MYQALYRKYRPSNFDEVEGQEVIVQTLKNAVINNKISHAYLFTGPRGTGKTSIAKIFAKTVNCDDPKDGIACNKCVFCTQIEEKKTTDIIEIDAASNNGVDEIRELKSKVNLVPNNNKYKVYIIDEVHMLTKGAFNALLKTLEEPPSHVIFILATTEPQSIPATILSRCQRYDFKKLSIESITKRLEYICKKEDINIDKKALNEIARISDGGMRDSISILDQVVSYKTNNITIEDVHEINGTLTQKDLKEFIKYLLEANVEEVFNLIDIYNKKGKNLQRLLDEIILYLRNLILYIETPNYLLKNDIDVEDYKEFENTPSEKIYSLISNLNELSNKMKNTSNPKIVFEIEILRSIFISREIILPKIDNIKEIQKEEKKPEKVIITNKMPTYEIPEEIIKQLKNIRIENVLSKLDKKFVNLILKEREKLNNYVINNEYDNFISLLLDGNIKAAGNNGLIYVYEYENDSSLFNNNILNLEKIYQERLNRNIKLISVTQEEWEIIKDEYNKRKRNYEYKDDNIDLSIYIKKEQNNNEIENMFNDIVEYTKEEI